MTEDKQAIEAIKKLLIGTFAQTVEYGAMCDDCCSSGGSGDTIICEMSDKPLKPDDYCPTQIACIDNLTPQILQTLTSLGYVKLMNPKEPVESNGATALPTNKKLPPYVFTVGKEPVTEPLSRTERHIQEYEESLQKEPCPDDEEEASPINCKDLCENYPKCYPFVSPVACTDFKLKEDGTGRSK
jgi:hypothetical protein